MSQERAMSKEQFMYILEQMDKVCQNINRETKQKEPESKLRYEVLQLSDLAKNSQNSQNTLRQLIKAVADFYNSNWKGNADFMHIPNFEQVMHNISRYPIIIAREEDSNEILAISTIKYDENPPDKYDNRLDPYFPFANAKYFSVTGILTRQNAPYRGMGKKIYEIALKGAFQYNQKYSGTTLMFVVDSRNSPSLNACASALKQINAEEYVAKGMGLSGIIKGFYELYDRKKHLAEGPTIVGEVSLDPVDKSSLPAKGVNLRFYRQSKKPLFRSLQHKLTHQLRSFGIKKPTKRTDPDAGTVFFYELTSPCSIPDTRISPRNTAKGNDRSSLEQDPTASIPIPKDFKLYFGPKSYLSSLKVDTYTTSHNANTIVTSIQPDQDLGENINEQ